MFKIIKENRHKISVLAKQFKTQLTDKIDEMKKDYNDQIKLHETENNNEMKNINNKINEINDKLENEYDKKLEEILVQATKFDIMDLIKDNGDGTVDATKIMVKALEDKVFKKIEFVESRNQKFEANSNIAKKSVDLIMPQFKKITNDIEKLNNISDKQKDLIEKNRFEINNNKRELEEKLDKIIDKIFKKTNYQLEEIKKENNEKFKLINTKLNEIKKNEGGELFNLGLGGIDNETLEDINKKIADLRKKINDIENSLKLHLSDDEKEIMKNDIKDIKSILEKKISNDNLKELYNFHLSDLDEINDIKDTIHKLNTDYKKQRDKIDNISKSLSLTQTNINKFFESNNNNNSNYNTPIIQTQIIDFTKYIDQTKLTETLRPIIKQLENILKEVESLRRNLTDQQEETKKIKENINIDQLKEEINTKINEIKLLLHKKYIEKIEYNKTIKNLEAKIYTSNEDSNKKNEGENWLLAKKNLNCFNCASCEANLKNETPQREYMHWNKYPPGEKIYRMGQGFSHMLQMMTTEFIKNVEHNIRENSNLNNENNILNDISNNDGKLMNIMNNINTESCKLITSPNERHTFGLKINNREQSIDEMNLYNRKSGKTRLPIVSKFGKKSKPKLEEVIPVSDDDKEKNDISLKMKYSPKIVKIMKKKNFAQNFDKSDEGNYDKISPSIKFNPPTNLKMSAHLNSKSVNTGPNN